uniref:YfhO family protein n=1 Tax=candidate division WOR-3 bacterium TaxID=2052148 RepID=A0A7C4GAY9_UNCW3
MTDRRLNRIVIAVLFLLPVLLFLKYLFGSRMLFGTDWLGGGSYAAHRFMADYIRNHWQFAFWQPHILCGQPTAAAFFGDMFYWPLVALRLILPVHVVWTWTFVLHLFLAGLGTYLFLRELDIPVLPAGLGGIAYMLAGSLITLTYAGHDGRLIGSALLPLALFFLHRGMTSHKLIHFLLCGLTVGMQLLSGHVQKVYYTGLMLVAFFLFMLARALRREKSFRLGLRLAGAFAIGLAFAGAFAAIQYLPIYGNLPYGARGAERGYEFATSWSMPIAETFDLLTPKFSGGLHDYWSRNPFKLHSEYLGILPLLFALIAVVRLWRRPQVRFFFFSFIAALVMAWGGNTPFYRLAYLLPGIAKFRGPAMIFFAAAFSLVVLAGFGLGYVLQPRPACPAGRVEEPPPRRKTRTADRRPRTPGRRLPDFVRPAVFAGILLLAFLLFAAIGHGALTSLLNPGPRLAAFNANYSNLLSGLAFATLLWAVGILLATLAGTGRLTAPTFTAITALVMFLDISISLDLWNEDKGYIRSVPAPAEYFAPDDVVAALKTDTTLYRVLPLNYGTRGRDYSQEGRLWLHDIQSVSGQLPNPLQSWQDFIGAGSSVMFQAGNLAAPNFLNLTNVKYVIGPVLPDDLSDYDEQTRRYVSQLRLYFSQPWFEPLYTGRQFTVYRNRNVLPRAYVAASWQVAHDKDEVLAALHDEQFDPARVALLYEDPGLPLPPTSDTAAGSAAITLYDPNRIIVHAALSRPGILVLSENWQPDWQARVDGKPARILRAFHTFRAVPLDPGDHTIELRYDSPHFRLGALLSALAMGFFVAVAAVSLLLRRRHVALTSAS